MGVTFAVIQLVSIGAAIAMLCHKDALGEWDTGSKTGPALA